MWLPKKTLFERRVLFGLQLGVLYGALFSSFYIAASFGLPQPTWLNILLLTPVPHLSIFILNARSVCKLQDSLTPAYSRDEPEWENCVRRIKDSVLTVNNTTLPEYLFIGWILSTHEHAEHPFRNIADNDLPGRTPAPFISQCSMVTRISGTDRIWENNLRADGDRRANHSRIFRSRNR